MRWILSILLVLLLLPFAALGVLAVLPDTWLADRLETAADRFAGIPVSIDTADVEVFTLEPGIRLGKVSTQANSEQAVLTDLDAAVSIDLAALFTGQLIIDRIGLDGGQIALLRDAEGNGNWQALLPEPDPDAPEEPAVAPPEIRQIDIRNIDIRVDDRLGDHRLELDLGVSGSTLDDDDPVSLSIEGNYQEVPLTINAEARQLLESNQFIDVVMTLAEARVTIDGQLGDLESPDGLDLQIEGSLPDSSLLETLLKTDLPTLPELTLAANLQRAESAFVVRRFDLQFGETVLEGDVRVNPDTQPLSLFANVIARPLALDELLALAEAAAPKDESAEGDEAGADDEAPAEAPDASGDRQRLIPSTPIDLSPLTDALQGAINLTAKNVQTETYPLRAFDVQLELDDEGVLLDPLRVDLADGRVTGLLALDLSASPMKTQLEFQAKHVDLAAILASVGIENPSFGVLGGEAKFWSAGDNPAALAAGLDGGMFLLMTQGELDLLLAELAGLDVFETLIDLIDPRDDLTPIECAYADLHAEAGLIDINHLVIDTADTLFLADGEVNLGEESLDVVLEPHPKDPSLLSAKSAVALSGVLGDLSVETGVELPARVVAAAALATLASPAAALLPLLQPGGGEDPAYCKGLLAALDKTSGEQ